MSLLKLTVRSSSDCIFRRNQCHKRGTSEVAGVHEARRVSLWAEDERREAHEVAPLSVPEDIC